MILDLHCDCVQHDISVPACRLVALQLVMKEWGGPVALTIYIEYLADSAEGSLCAQQVTEYLEQQIQRIWPAPGAAPAVSVSLMFAVSPLDHASCKVPASEPHEIQGGHTRATSEFVTNLGQATDYGKPRTPSYILRRFSRSLLITEMPPVTDPGGGPALLPAWHFHPRSLYHDVPVGSQPWQQEYAQFYPVNALRNLAWSRVLIPPELSCEFMLRLPAV